MIDLQFSEVMQVLTLLAVVLIFYWSHRSFPPQQTADLLDRLSQASAKTPTKVDDLLIDIAEVLNDLRRQTGVSPEPLVASEGDSTEAVDTDQPIR